MAGVPKFNITKRRGYYIVQIPVAFSSTGARQQRSFRIKRDAEDFAATMKRAVKANGENFSVLPPRVQDDALAAWELLSAYGISLLDAAREVVSRVEFERASPSVSDAVFEWQKSYENLRDRTKSDYDFTAKKIIEMLGERKIASVSIAEIQNLIPSDSGSYANQIFRNLRAFFNFCANPKRKWCEENLFELVEKPKTSKDKGEISLISARELRVLLRVCERYFPEIVWFVVVRAFAGVRTNEAALLKKEHFSDEGLKIPREIAKRGARFIKAENGLAEWLQAYPFQEVSGLVEIDEIARRVAGWDIKERNEMMRKFPSFRGKWQQNCIRHTHASACVAIGKNLQDLIFEFGHSKGVDILRAHYVGAMTEKEARDFFSIRPIRKFSEARTYRQK